MKLTVVFEKLAQALSEKKRHIWLEGGTYASKTISALQLLYLIAIGSKRPLLISIVSESVPHIRRGCLRDFKGEFVLGNSYEPQRFNKTDSIYDCGKVKIEFFSADDSSKLRGARRDILFINEANNITYDAFRELDSRTRICTIADWNPVSEFWYHQNRLGDSPDSVFIHCTYKDALDVTPKEVIANILEMGKRDPNWANIYLEGRLGKIEGLVYPLFNQVKELPAGEIFYGLDFGFSTDVTALVKNVVQEDSLYSQELIYERGLTNQDIAQRMTELGVKKHSEEIFADSSEPKSIEEIYQYGFNIKPCTKGPGSVEYSHQKVRQYKQFWTEDSLNCIKEQRNFRYLPDKNGKLTDKTTHIWSHGQDARRYAISGRAEPQPIERVVEYDTMELVPNMDL